jgi:hypothetical protein
MRSVFYPTVAARNSPSFFAPPAAWAVASFVGELIDSDGPIDPRETGLLVVSDECSLASIRDLSASLTRGALSPLRFAGSSPSILAGLASIQFALRGPTLCLTMAPEHAALAAAALVRFWLDSMAISVAIVVAHWPASDHGHLMTGCITRTGQDFTAEQLARRPHGSLQPQPPIGLVR